MSGSLDTNLTPRFSDSHDWQEILVGTRVFLALNERAFWVAGCLYEETHDFVFFAEWGLHDLAVKGIRDEVWPEAEVVLI